jgi:hypothetical protein
LGHMKPAGVGWREARHGGGQRRGGGGRRRGHTVGE